MPVSHPTLRDHRPAERGTHQKLTARGGLLGALSLAACIFGYLLPEPHLLHLGMIGITALVLSWPLAKWNLQSLSSKRSVPESAFAGEAFPVEITLKNNRPKLDAFSIDYEDGVAGPKERGLHAGWVKAGGSASRKFKTRLLRRGISHRLRGSVESSFPLGLWKARDEFKETLEMIIIPRPIAPRILDDPEFVSLLEADDSESSLVDYSGDFHGLREFQPGDRVKHIDWPATARSGKIMVRKYDKRLPSRFLIVFHSIAPKSKQSQGEAFDSAMEMLCGLLMALNDRGIPMDLAASFNGWKTLSMSGSEENLQKGLKSLAAARRTPEWDFGSLQKLLANVDSSQRVFVLSDIPVKDWESELPELPCLLTCLSVSDLRVRQPKIYRRA